jgi:Gas vesicle synthesis protein GvpL/GvpF
VLTPTRFGLYAVVPTGDAGALGVPPRGVRQIACGPVLAIVGKATGQPETRAALRHDRIVRQALDVCASVVPFRLGVEFGSEAEIQRMLEANREPLSRQLARFAGRVEMGFKVQLAAQPAGMPVQLPAGLPRVHALAPRPEDRREHLARAPGGQVFEGCYLVLREAIESFWSAVEELRRAAMDLPVLGSGPWAAYSFCDFVLRPAQPARAERPLDSAR